ncbi:MAG: hypothetical protein KBA42_06440 [Bacteroidales bacterium]|nr:hypothetical protein [Bacteroidales bacterium]MBP9028569.1 hypothetical protein [Bacteroidales bacterium]HRR11046.1 hypothetical protein [Tenuifilum sp.]
MKKSKLVLIYVLVVIASAVIVYKTSVHTKAECSNLEELSMPDDDSKRPLLQTQDGSYVCGCTSYSKCSVNCK